VVEAEEIQPEIEAASEPKDEEVPQVKEIIVPEVVLPPQVVFNEFENQLLDEIKGFQAPSELPNFADSFSIHKDIYS